MFYPSCSECGAFHLLATRTGLSGLLENCVLVCISKYWHSPAFQLFSHFRVVLIYLVIYRKCKFFSSLPEAFFIHLFGVWPLQLPAYGVSRFAVLFNVPHITFYKIGWMLFFPVVHTSLDRQLGHAWDSLCIQWLGKTRLASTVGGIWTNPLS